MKPATILTIFLLPLVWGCGGSDSPHQVDWNHPTCSDCHADKQQEWASPQNFHAASAAAVLTNVNHNTNELLNDNCIKCHSTFQLPLGIGHFVTPLDQVGQPAGTWTALNTGDWQATKCEVCHDLSATNPRLLAKYGSILDGGWSPAYLNAANLPQAYQTVIDPTTGASSTYAFPSQNTQSVQATRLCNSCHDPADQGGDPNIVLGGIDFGPQGGDSRAYVTTSHQGMACVDCHATHDFTPSVPTSAPSCAGAACHSTPRDASFPGKVHINHL
jgi:hypothetical protein